jgi:hypothetical protein
MNIKDYKEIIRREPGIVFFLIFILIVLCGAILSLRDNKKRSENPSYTSGEIFDYHKSKTTHNVKYFYYVDSVRYEGLESSDFELAIKERFTVKYQKDDPLNSVLLINKQLFNYPNDSLNIIKATITRINNNKVEYEYQIDKTNFQNTKYNSNFKLKKGDIICIKALKSNPKITKPDFSNVIGHAPPSKKVQYILFSISCILILLFIRFLPINSIIKAKRYRLKVSTIQILLIKFRRIKLDILIDSMVKLKQYNIEVSPDLLEIQYLYGGDMINYSDGIIENKKLALNLSFDQLLKLSLKNDPLSKFLKDHEYQIKNADFIIENYI